MPALLPLFHATIVLAVVALLVFFIRRARTPVAAGGRPPATIHGDTTGAEGGGAVMDSKYCFGCGVAIHRSAAQCPHCGARQSGGQGRSRVTAALFALFLGGIGIHKFYLGRVGQGVFYLLFCWTFIPAFVALVEGIIYLASSDETFALKYG